MKKTCESVGTRREIRDLYVTVVDYLARSQFFDLEIALKSVENNTALNTSIKGYEVIERNSMECKIASQNKQTVFVFGVVGIIHISYDIPSRVFIIEYDSGTRLSFRINP